MLGTQFPCVCKRRIKTHAFHVTWPQMPSQQLLLLNTGRQPTPKLVERLAVGPSEQCACVLGLPSQRGVRGHFGKQAVFGIPVVPKSGVGLRFSALVPFPFRPALCWEASPLQGSHAPLIGPLRQLSLLLSVGSWACPYFPADSAMCLKGCLRCVTWHSQVSLSGRVFKCWL